MTAVLYGLQVLTLAALGFLGWQYFALRRTARALAQRAAGLLPAPPVSAESRTPLITIEILNAMELATRESWLAQAFGNITPSLVRREVYRQAQKIIEDELARRGVAADVELHA